MGYFFQIFVAFRREEWGSRDAKAPGVGIDRSLLSLSLPVWQRLRDAGEREREEHGRSFWHVRPGSCSRSFEAYTSIERALHVKAREKGKRHGKVRPVEAAASTATTAQKGRGGAEATAAEPKGILGEATPVARDHRSCLRAAGSREPLHVRPAHCLPALLVVVQRYFI